MNTQKITLQQNNIILGNRFFSRVKELVHDPIFSQPIKVTDYSNPGFIKCVTNFSKLLAK